MSDMDDAVTRLLPSIEAVAYKPTGKPTIFVRHDWGVAVVDYNWRPSFAVNLFNAIDWTYVLRQR